MEAPKPLKRRKITDKTIPSSLAESYEDYQLYEDLSGMERNLDWTVTRKRVELQDTLVRTHSTRKVLRVFISHSTSNQIWQNALSEGEPTIDFQTGRGIPSWKLKVEGRLLEGSQKFSSLLKALTIELDRDPTTYPDTNVVEWHRTAGHPEQDGFEIERRGDITTRARVVLHVDQNPERYKLTAPLADLLQIKEGSRSSTIAALWNYVKINQLQDKVDRRLVKADARLQALWGRDSLMFHNLPEIVDRNLMPPDPFLLPYTVVVDPEHTTGSRCFDLDIELEDIAYKSTLTATMEKLNSSSLVNLATLEDEIANAAQSIRTSKLKREFFTSLAQEPQTFIHNWLNSQSKDLDLVLGNDHGVREEDLKNTEFFQMPWVDEAVSIHEGIRVAGALQKLHEGR